MLLHINMSALYHLDFIYSFL